MRPMADRPVDSLEVRTEVRAWLAHNWDPELPLLEWRGRLADSGWACPTWPRAWFGSDLDTTNAAVVAEEFARVGAVGAAIGAGMSLAAPTILEHGSAELRTRLLRSIITGEHKWCQLFSEPGNGSDLAGLTTTARRDGDEWIVSGQKVWTSGARTATYGMLLARTDWDTSKHRGITYFALRMDQPGIEVRPLRQMNTKASFNEVFLTDVRLPDCDRISGVGEGWRAALTTLAHERAAAGMRAPQLQQPPSGRTAREAHAEASEYLKTYDWYPQRAGRTDLLVEHARRAGRNSDVLIRNEVASAVSFSEAAKWTARRAASARAAGRAPGPDGSLGKLSGALLARTSASAHARIAGPHGMLGAGPDAPFAGVIAEILVSVPGHSIAGGTDEIQRNIIGERILGLPKEPADDGERPFRDLRRN